MEYRFGDNYGLETLVLMMDLSDLSEHLNQKGIAAFFGAASFDLKAVKDFRFKKPSISTLLFTHVALTGGVLKSQAEELQKIKNTYDLLHKEDPSKQKGIYLINTHYSVPVFGGTGGNIKMFYDIATGKNLGTIF